eukprot:7391094-Prymnesium_polylepis.1
MQSPAERGGNGGGAGGDGGVEGDAGNNGGDGGKGGGSGKTANALTCAALHCARVSPAALVVPCERINTRGQPRWQSGVIPVKPGDAAVCLMPPSETQRTMLLRYAT